MTRKLLLMLIAGAPFCNLSTAASAPLSFSVASIHQNLHPTRWRMEFTADGLTAEGVPLAYVLHEAWGLYDDKRWSGAPAWIKSTYFNIEARYDPGDFKSLTLDQRRTMLQNLLADRFHLAMHHETRKLPVYALVVAKHVPHLQAAAPDQIVHSSTNGDMCFVSRRSSGAMQLQGCTMNDLASMLTTSSDAELRRTVIDQSGLTGRYDLNLRWSRQMSGSGASDGAAAPFIFTAIEQQLGLRLVSTTAPLDTIVIDHIETPSPN